MRTAIVLATLAGCGDDGFDGSGGGGGGDSDTDADTDGDTDADTDVDGDCASFEAEGWTILPALRLALRETRTSVAPASVGGGPVFGAADGSGTVVGWAAGGGQVRLTAIDAAGAISGDDPVVDGDEIHGLALVPDGRAVLVYRGPDVLALVKVDLAGALVFDERQLGGVPQDVTGNEWWQTIWFMGEGRLLWTGARYVAYFQVRRLWDDGIAHVGDTLRFFAPDGSRAEGGWGWGCSHSMDQRLALSRATVGPVCVSDCYPGQGVYFNHSTEVSLEPGGDCAGQIGATAGGLAPVADGFFLTWGSSAGRSSHDIAIVHVDLAGAVGPKSWLTDTPADEAAGHLAAFGDGLLAGWRSSAGQVLARLDASGAISAGPEPSPFVFRDFDDFLRWESGDVGWVRGEGSDLVVVRARECE